MRGAISPSMFVLAWMSVISCSLMRQGMGRPEAVLVILSVTSSLLALLSEAGVIEAKAEEKKSPLDQVLQLAALCAFVVRVGAYAYIVTR